MPERPVVLTAFANSLEADYLAELVQERDRLQQILAPLPYLQHLDLPSAKTRQLVGMLTQFKDELLIFHFGGHADGSQLYFDDAGGHVLGLAQLLALHPELKLVFLNGCNTQAQAAQYLDLGIPAVIATTCPVADGQAKQFAETFYTGLVAGHTLKEAFQLATGAMKLTQVGPAGEEIVNLRGVRLRNQPLPELSWRLYVTNDEVLDWKLQEIAAELSVTTNTQDIAGSGINAFQNLHNSTVSVINNYGLAPAPLVPQHTDEFLDTLAKLSYKQSPPSELYLVNCDRTHQLLDMQDHREKSPGHQFYFILSCPSQHPRSLVQRYIFDILDQFDQDTARRSIQYKRIQEFDGARRMAIQIVEAGRKVEWLQRDWLAQVQKSSQDFSAFLEVELPQLKHDYLAAGYEFFAGDWPLDRFELLLKNWLQCFSTKASAGPQCLFFFILNIDSIHCKNSLSLTEMGLVNCIQELATLHAEDTLVIDQLPQVEVRDVQTWLDKLLEGGKRRTLFEIWCKKNEVRSGFAPDDRLDMADASTFMQELWNQGRQIQKTI
ncbi:CHAT domain-containing protein [Haliscomenobacter hydrossis]|uniref:CHAT domain-containing protein n=1 Tax=Haliscomenobacter hydrossis (strain ATCC 27775 / DSM 1100 / LMG 10767 / O) TaxID=760192 RepID=F4L7M6_HALH1|nr:CHAT domain-containing protein [Haliscomenobacter hydrossis]AEE54384.1 hypothetical protein Halhy_6568 [Haliscomenobacter hydrossis DSM 1100]